MLHECPTSFFTRSGENLHSNSTLIRDIIATKERTSLEDLPIFFSDAIIKYEDAYLVIEQEKNKDK